MQSAADTSTEQSQQSALPPTRGARPSRVAWFSIGVAAGVALTVIVALAVPRVGGQAGDPRRADHAAVATLAKLVAHPLLPQGCAERKLSDAEALAALASRASEADALASENTELSPIAQEFADALRALQSLGSDAPSAQPLLRAGLETWRGSVEKDDRAFVSGLFSIGSELSKFAELSDKAKAVHARIVACRLRLAEIAIRTALPAATDNTVSVRFLESGHGNRVADDTAFLTNVSGARLTQVLVVLEMTGAGGETFSNCFFADAWEPGQTLLAVCRSESPDRETVHDVKRLRVRVLAAERSSRTAELAF